MMKQIRLVEATGKTVRGVAGVLDNLLITFTDGTLVHLGVEIGCDRDGAVVDKAYNIGGSDVCVESAIAAGLYTREEYEALSKARDRDFAARREAAERKQYEELRAKFGQTP